MTGSWGGAQSKEAIELALGGCSQVRAAMRDVLLAAAEGAGQRRQGQQEQDQGGTAPMQE
jgi:hypothetical protein